MIPDYQGVAESLLGMMLDCQFFFSCSMATGLDGL